MTKSVFFILARLMSLLFLSFISWMITIVAPCVLPLLPVIIGGSVKDGKKSQPWIIILSFAVSVLFFTLAAKRLFDQLGLGVDALTNVSAIILIVFWVFLFFPDIRQTVMGKIGLEHWSNKSKANIKRGVGGDIALGAVLWPIFNTCSPTYAILVANILPVSFARWLANIIAYILWLTLLLSAIAYGGRKIIGKLKRASNPHGLFKKIIAWLLVFVGLAIFMWRDKKVEIRMIDQWLAIDTTQWELNELQDLDEI